MDLTHSLPNRSNTSNFRVLSTVIVLGFIFLAIIQMASFFPGISRDPASVLFVSRTVFSAAPQVISVPTPSQANWQHVVPQISATPAPAASQPTAQPVATPLAGK